MSDVLLNRLREEAVAFAEHELPTVEEVRPLLLAVVRLIEGAVERDLGLDKTQPAAGVDVEAPAEAPVPVADVPVPVAAPPAPDYGPVDGDAAGRASVDEWGPANTGQELSTPAALTADERRQLAELQARAAATDPQTSPEG